MAKITSWKLWKTVKVYSNHGNTQSGKSHIQVVGNIMAFLLTLGPLPPPVAQHSLKEATTQFQIPCLQPEGAEWPYLQHSDLSGGCLRDWCLFFLTWNSHREKLHSLDRSWKLRVKGGGVELSLGPWVTTWNAVPHPPLPCAWIRHKLYQVEWWILWSFNYSSLVSLNL